MMSKCIVNLDEEMERVLKHIADKDDDAPVSDYIVDPELVRLLIEIAKERTVVTVGKCDICGAPATRLAHDMTDMTRDGDAWAWYEPRGDTKRGCATHPVASDTYNKAGEIKHGVTVT